MIWKGAVQVKINKATIIRTIMLFIAIINIVLEMRGVKTIPVDNELVSEAVSVGFLLVSAVMAWWKNNSFTSHARAADEYMKSLKEDK